MKSKHINYILFLVIGLVLHAHIYASSLSSPKGLESNLIDVGLLLEETLLDYSTGFSNDATQLDCAAATPFGTINEIAVEDCDLSNQIDEKVALTTPFGTIEEYSIEGCTVIQEEPSTSQKTPEETPTKSQSSGQILPPVADLTTHCPPDTENEGYVINFSDINFEEYLHFLSKLTNTNFVYNSEDVQFNISIMADEPTNIKEVRSALMQILRVQGLSLVEDGNNIIISKDPALRSVGNVISEDLGNVCEDTEPLITRVFYLKNVSATKVAAIVSSMVSASAIVEASEETHHLIVTDLSSNILGIGDLLKSLDNPEAAFEIGTYKAKKTYITNLITLAEKIMFPLLDGTSLVMVPQEKSSTIFIVSTPYLVQKSLEVLQALDEGDQPDSIPDDHQASAEFMMYKLQYHKGTQIQNTLKEVAEDLTHMGNINAHLLMTINSAQWIQTTNSLLFIGNAQNLAKIKDLLKVIDAPLRQVFIEVLAVRTSIANSLELGVQYGYRGKATDRLSATGTLLNSANPNVAGNAIKPNIFTQGLDAVTGPGVPVPQTSNALGFTSGVIGNVLFNGGNLYFDLAALVNALQTDTATDVITNPKLVTQDTIPATFYVGSTRPFQTNSILQASGASSGNFVTASIEYRQLGLSLTVTPYLGSGDTITLEVEQSTSDFVDNAVPSSGGGSDNFAIVPVTNDSSITTRVHIPNKHFLMVSGMLEEVKTRTKTALPCLGGIPIIGDLLGVKANSSSKDNFIMFIRPQIIDTIEELDSITAREDQLFRDKNKQDSFIKNSEKLYFMNK